MIELMKGGLFLNLNEIETYEFLENLSESSQQWDHSQRDRNSRKAGLHEISADTSINIKLDALTRKVEALTMSKPIEPVMSVQREVCTVCASPMHPTSQCPTFLAFPDQFPEQANVMYDNNKFGNTYNPNWRNHPNLAWKPNPPQPNFGGPNNFGGQNNFGNQNQNIPKGQQPYRPPFQQPQRYNEPPRAQPSLEDTLKAFMQTTSQNLSRLETQIGQLAAQTSEREKGKLPSQIISNPKTQCNLASSSTPSEHVQAITTLRSGRRVDNNVVNPDFVQEQTEEVDTGNKEVQTEDNPHE